ncbi:MAG: chemotaxis protein CheA, partial [Oscillospiraceae bacterium]|nr:chemotaxis protein CheA [Oscillospiraceae bacterium]
EGDILTAAFCGALLQGFADTSFVEIFCPDWKGGRVMLSHRIEGAINVKSYEVLESPVQADPAPAEEPAKGPAAEKAAEPAPAEEPAKAEPAVQAAAKAEKPVAAAPAQTTEQINNKLAQQKNTNHATKGKQSLISVNLNKLDQLLDMVGEIVIAEAMVTSNPDLKGLKLDNFQKSARELRKLTDELQDIVMSIRMVPLSGVFNKMTRIVRDMKVKLNKDVNLVFEGEETEVDKSVIDNLNDPLMHMVRNSMDHGIEETQEERIAAGKPAQGTITLAAYNSSGEVIIVVSDDGGGIDTQKVLSKAMANGLLTKPAEEYTDKEIFNMVMLPGFSTNTEVTEFSGRGVGMDVVRQSIEKIGGSVSVDSKKGEGTNFIIKIPLSLAIIDGIEVSVGKSIFTIPTNTIKKFIKLKEGQLFYDTSQKEIIKDGNKCYPLIRLHQFYNIEPTSDNIYDGVVVLVESEGRSACILVDELIGEQQVVVKPFSPMFNRYNIKQQGMAGCTILGDGSITIILDIDNIINEN